MYYKFDYIKIKFLFLIQNEVFINEENWIHLILGGCIGLRFERILIDFFTIIKSCGIQSRLI
jgi:hypothetical protein